MQKQDAQEIPDAGMQIFLFSKSFGWFDTMHDCYTS
jgi:hypothetical protein